MFPKRIFSAVILLLLFSVSTFAFDIPDPNGYVTDQAGIFSYEEEMSLEFRIQEIEDATTAEIAILTVLTTDGEDISQLAFDVGNEWGVGKSENDNGLVILVAIDDRAWFMATGYGLEGVLPDAITKRIAENRFPYYFRDALYADGLLAALDDVEGYLVNDPSVIAEYDTSSYSSDSGDMGNPIWFIVLIFFAIAKSVWVGVSKKKKRLNVSLFSNGLLLFFGIAFCGWIFTLIVLVFSVLFDIAAMSDSKGGKGGGRSSGSSSSRSSWSSSSSSSSSSSGGSFGGGSFGGGGSGGRW